MIVASASQMEKEALRHFHKLCFMRTVFLSVRALRAMGEDVKVCPPYICMSHPCDLLLQLCLRTSEPGLVCVTSGYIHMIHSHSSKASTLLPCGTILVVSCCTAFMDASAGLAALLWILAFQAGLMLVVLLVTMPWLYRTCSCIWPWKRAA